MHIHGSKLVVTRGIEIVVLMKFVLFEIERIQEELIFNVGGNAIFELRIHCYMIEIKKEVFLVAKEGCENSCTPSV